MAIRQSELPIDTVSPFANCKLGREKYANILTSILQSNPEGFVLSINNKWGTGKTTFVKMWRQLLKNQGYYTVYFNAWENDFEDSPLTALMAELKTVTKQPTEQRFKTLIKSAAILSKNVAPALAKAIAEKYIKTEVLKSSIEGATTGFLEIFETQIDEYSKKKKSIKDFQGSLFDFIDSTTDEKPLVFIVDELDRCRPNYAVSILEQIKHFFSVEKIVFVLSIDKVQLGNAVRGVYGSDNIDADEYLRRFIDLEYSIPEPDNGVFFKYLYEKLRFDEFFQSAERIRFLELRGEKERFLSICELLFTKSIISLRQQERIFTISRLVLRSFPNNHYVIPEIFIFLSYLKIAHFSFYESLKQKKLTMEKLQVEFKSIVDNLITESSIKDLVWLEVYLINFYNNYYFEPNNRKNRLLQYDQLSGKNLLKLNSVIDIHETGLFLSIFENLSKGRGTEDISLSYFINKLELLENLA
ncbi:MAG: hypothetical protein IT236_02690 [Bacteroidia bacterium]|nr:hypothetical protein [Bacteroidia bacterium]